MISDKMFMLHGDGPASQFEIGNSKGDYFRCCCDVPSFYMILFDVGMLSM